MSTMTIVSATQTLEGAPLTGLNTYEKVRRYDEAVACVSNRIAESSMNLSYNAVVTLLQLSLHWPMKKAQHVLLAALDRECAPDDRDAPLVPVSRVAVIIDENIVDRNNPEY